MSHDTPILNLDVDGVLYGFTDAMRIEVNAVMGIPTDQLPDPDQWSIHKSWPITGKQFHSIMYDGIAQGRLFRRGELLGGYKARQALWDLQEHGWHIRITTSKTFRDPVISKIARSSTLEWLGVEDVPFDSISFTSSDIGKVSLRADAIVDDKPKLGEWAQYGADNFLFDQPWNQQVEPGILYHRVSTLLEVAEILIGEPE